MEFNLKILHVISDLSQETGGTVSVLLGLSQAQAQLGHNVRIVSTDYNITPEYDVVGATVCKCTFPKWRYSPTLKAELQKMVVWADVVHVHMMWEYPALVALFCAKKMNKPCFLMPHGMLDRWSLTQSSFKKKIYLRLFSKVLFSPNITLHFTTEAEKNKSVFPCSLETVVVANGIGEAAFSKTNTAKSFLDKYPNLKGKEIVLFLGRVHVKKQPEIAIKAFAQNFPNFPNAYLVIAGPCPSSYQAELEQLIAELEIKDRVLFTGMLEGSELYGAYQAANVFVLPSHQENFGLAVVEAMAAGCPVIVSGNVDIHDYITTGNAGLVCAASVDAFSAALSKVLAGSEEAVIMGENGRVVAEKYFKWGRAAAFLEEIYRDVILKKQGEVAA